MGELLEGHRGQEDGVVQVEATELQPCMATLEVFQRPIEQAQALEGRAVVGQGEFVRRAAGQVGPGLGRHTLAGEGLVVGDRGDFGRYLLELGKGRHGGRAQVFDQCRSRLW
ncbi:hypothetical protein D3C84_381490 [compost metagenome]